MIQQSTHYKDW